MLIESLQYFAQLSDYDCGVGITGIVSESTRTTFNYENACQELGTTEEWGTEPYMIAKYFRRRGFEVALTLNTPVEAIVTNMGLGKICVAMYQNCRYSRQVSAMDSGHYGVISRISAGIVKIMDPDSSTGQYDLSEEEFRHRFKDVDARGVVLNGGILTFTPPWLLENNEK